MDMEIYFPQLEEMLDRDAAIKDLLNMMADRMNALENAIAAITPAATMVTPASTTPAAEQTKPAKGKPKRRTITSPHDAGTTDTQGVFHPPAKGQRVPVPDGADGAAEDTNDDEDEEDLRARASFEARRTTRLYGIAGTRAAIKKIAGANVLNVDDVPVAKLPALITALQAL
jgi:hypothetical protein